MSRASIRMGAWLSSGMKTGIATGFDSGSTLDYVYENDARGTGFIGRMIDRTFLDAIGWRGIRQRKLHLEELIGNASPPEGGRPPRPHRSTSPPAMAAMCSTPSPNARNSRRACGCRITPTSTSARPQADRRAAVCRPASASTRPTPSTPTCWQRSIPAPDLAIVSGLYELFSDNAMISRSLGGLASAMQPGALLIYTNQPWHPQLEMIARSLTSHRGGQAWVMRRRTQAEMDQLVEAAGFEKIDQRIDQWGIFTVSVARRV